MQALAMLCFQRARYAPAPGRRPAAPRACNRCENTRCDIIIMPACSPVHTRIVGHSPGAVEDGIGCSAPARAAETSSWMRRRTSSRDIAPSVEAPEFLASADVPGSLVGGGVAPAFSIARGLSREKSRKVCHCCAASPGLPTCCWCRIALASWPNTSAHAQSSFLAGWTAHARASCATAILPATLAHPTLTTSN